MCPLQKSQEFAGKATKLIWGRSLMSVLIARTCTAMYSRLFPCLIILVKSKVKGCFLTSKSQISIHSKGKTALKLQKTVTSSWTHFSWQFNSSSSTSTNCAQGRDVMNNWCGVVESCSEGSWAQRNCPFILFPSFTLQHNQFSSMSLDKEWSWHITQGRAQTFSTVAQLRSCIWFHQPHPSELQWWPQRAAFQGMESEWRINTAEKPQETTKKVHFLHFLFSWS